MGKNSKIQWTEHTWNIINGCEVCGPGCKNCYAMRLAGTRLKNHPSREGLTTKTAAHQFLWNGKVRMYEPWLHQPLKWKMAARIFVCAHGDLFYEQVPEKWIDMVYAVMVLAAHHTFQTLTKRSARQMRYLNNPDTPRRIANEAEKLCERFGIKDRLAGNLYRSLKEEHPKVSSYLTQWPLPNVHVGVSIEDQDHAFRAIDLCLTKAAVRWISAEPLLEPLDLRHIEGSYLEYPINVLTNRLYLPDPNIRQDYAVTPTSIDQVIAGGESGPNFRIVDTAAFRSLRDQCARTDTAFFMKQMSGGAKVPIPDDLQIFEEPNVAW
ncbi:MAG: DUF5131 family protein [Rhodobacteraceae bacterium]|nr:DUF5131 family protein [Paracoccaceae bacterium]